MVSVAVMIEETPSSGIAQVTPCHSPSRPRTGRRITRDSLLWMRPTRDGDGCGLSAQQVPISENQDDDITPRFELQAGLKESEVKCCAEIASFMKDQSKDDDGELSADEESTAGGSSSDGCRESSSDEDPLSPFANSLAPLSSPAVSCSDSVSPVKSHSISLEAALYAPISTLSNENVPPAPWWWPSPQFDAPEVESPISEKEVEDVPNNESPPEELCPPPGLNMEDLPSVAGFSSNVSRALMKAPPGLETTTEVPSSELPQAVSEPPKFDANCIGLVEQLTSSADSDMVPPPPTWSAEDSHVENILVNENKGLPLPPTWFPASPPCVPALDATPPPPSWWADETEDDKTPPPPSWSVDEMCSDVQEASDDDTPPPPTWSADEACSDDGESSGATLELNSPPSPSCPPPPVTTQVCDLTPPPPSYDAPGFEASSASPPTSPCFDSLPQNVAAPPAEPPKLVVSLENLGVAKAPPSEAPKELPIEAPKDLPKLQVSLEDLTSCTMAPTSAPPAYTAPAFMPRQHFNGMMPPNFSAPFMAMPGPYSSPMSAPPSWGPF